MATATRKQSSNKPPMVGSIGWAVASRASFNGRRFIFDGTTLDLVRRAVKMGASAGYVVHADFGAGMTAYVLYANPADGRCGGLWAKRV